MAALNPIRVLSGWPLVAKPLQGRGVATGGASGGVVDSIAQPRFLRAAGLVLQTPSKCPEALSKPSLLGRKASNSSIGQVRMVRDSSAETSSAAVRSFGKSCSFIAVAEVRFASQEALSAATTFPARFFTGAAAETNPSSSSWFTRLQPCSRVWRRRSCPSRRRRSRRPSAQPTSVGPTQTKTC